MSKNLVTSFRVKKHQTLYEDAYLNLLCTLNQIRF